MNKANHGKMKSTGRDVNRMKLWNDIINITYNNPDNRNTNLNNHPSIDA